jgi:2-keto-4-pentenoate hydratase/2-oxohepta-3-ene-1,7-dioic acid hydratase in catechol pathway
VSGPYDAIELPRGSSATDHQVDLGAIIRRRLRDCVDPDVALEAVGEAAAGFEHTGGTGSSGAVTPG